jgi:hypothetical protein
MSDWRNCDQHNGNDGKTGGKTGVLLHRGSPFERKQARD